MRSDVLKRNWTIWYQEANDCHISISLKDTENTCSVWLKNNIQSLIKCLRNNFFLPPLDQRTWLIIDEDGHKVGRSCTQYFRIFGLSSNYDIQWIISIYHKKFWLILHSSTKLWEGIWKAHLSIQYLKVNLKY